MPTRRISQLIYSHWGQSFDNVISHGCDMRFTQTLSTFMGSNFRHSR